jgi:hypothetical protein
VSFRVMKMKNKIVAGAFVRVIIFFANDRLADFPHFYMPPIKASLPPGVMTGGGH